MVYYQNMTLYMSLLLITLKYVIAMTSYNSMYVLLDCVNPFTYLTSYAARFHVIPTSLENQKSCILDYNFFTSYQAQTFLMS